MRIAVVGGGIAGMICALRLGARHEVVLYEAEPRLGGHTHTVRVDHGGRSTPVDTGFIVFNEENYPHLTRLFAELDVAHGCSDMSFGIRDDRTGLEYSPSRLRGLFAQPRRWLERDYRRLFRDIARFRREAGEVLARDREPVSIGAYLRAGGYGALFRDAFALPMGAAIWSASERQIDAFPARRFVEFFRHHRFFDLAGTPRWRYVRGGSSTYVDRLRARFAGTVRLGASVRSVRRLEAGRSGAGGVALGVAAEEEARFDHVVLATHADQSLALRVDRDGRESTILGALPYRANPVTLHRDTTVLPRARWAWASWNYRIPKAEPSDRHGGRVGAGGDGEAGGSGACGAEGEPVQGDSRTSSRTDGILLTYNMHFLQRIPQPPTWLVSLHAHGNVRPETVHYETTYEHPVFTEAGVEAQGRWAEISGRGGVHYAGAYWGYGFHEDGIRSGLRVCACIDPDCLDAETHRLLRHPRIATPIHLPPPRHAGEGKA